jgi:undecaprenyl pyrophosphate phosphatase UppP
MGMDSLENFIQILIALSVASERLVEIIKGFWPFLSKTNANVTREGWRRAILHVLGVISGIVTALLAQQWVGDTFPEGWNTPFALIVIGLLVSGGSGFWNAILSYLLQVKNLKKKDALK